MRIEDLSKLQEQAMKWYAEEQCKIDCDMHPLEQKSRFSFVDPERFRENIIKVVLSQENAQDRVGVIAGAYMELLTQCYGINSPSARSIARH